MSMLLRRSSGAGQARETRWKMGVVLGGSACYCLRGVSFWPVCGNVMVQHEVSRKLRLHERFPPQSP